MFLCPSPRYNKVTWFEIARTDSVASDQGRELRKQGIAAAKAGQKEEARRLLMQSLRLDPQNEAGWAWLASVARDAQERMRCLHRLLEINPDNEIGLQSLQALGLTREELAQQVSARPSASTPPVPAAEPPKPQAPGVPVLDAQQLAQMSEQIDRVVREYLLQASDYPGVTWTRKTRNRAGERDVVRLRAIIAGAVLAGMIGLFAVGYLVVWNTPALRGVVFVPTPTASPTPPPPTFTPTPTPGITPTPSPTPELTLTPSPTVPPNIPGGASGVRPTEIYPPAPDRALRDAIVLYGQGALEQALPTLEIEITRASTQFDAQPYYYAALALAAEGELERAEKLLLDAQTRLPERPDQPLYAALINSGLAYVTLLRAQAATADGNLRAADDLIRSVEDRALAAIEIDPRLERPYRTLSSAYALRGDFDRAVSVLDRGLSMPELAASIALIIDKGELFFQQGEYALADYQAFLALYINPVNEPAHQLRIRTALAQGDPGLGVIYSQAYLFYFPGSVQAYKLLGDARTAEGNYDLGLEAYNQALTAGNDADVLIARAALYMQERRYEQARADLTSALALRDDPTVRALRMQAAYAAGNSFTARSDVQALYGKGIVPDAELRLLEARLLLDEAQPDDQLDFERGLQLLDAALPSLPEGLRAVANEYRAQALYGLKRYNNALDAIDRALAGGESGGRRYLRGLILEAQGETDAARREYDWVLTLGELYPYSFLPDVRRRLAQLGDGK